MFIRRRPHAVVAKFLFPLWLDEHILRRAPVANPEQNVLLLRYLPEDSHEVRDVFRLLAVDLEYYRTFPKANLRGPATLFDSHHDNAFVAFDLESLLELFSYVAHVDAQVLDGIESWGPMAIASGRLIVRDLKKMTCLDISDK